MRLLERLRLHNWAINDDLPMFVADEVQSDMDKRADRTAPSAEDYGMVAPPYSDFWIEASNNEHDHPVIRAFHCSIAEEIRNPDLYHRRINDNEVMWQMWCVPYCGSGDYFGIGKCGILFEIDKDGHLVTDMNQISISRHENSIFENLPNNCYEYEVEEAVKFSAIALTTISLIHQKTEILEVSPDRNKHRKMVRSKGKSTLRTHYRIVVGNRTKETTGLPRIDQSLKSSTKRKGTVRGTMKYYHPEAPLFGRVSGCVWVPEHTRGDGDEVTKHYHVKA